MKKIVITALALLLAVSVCAAARAEQISATALWIYNSYAVYYSAPQISDEDAVFITEDGNRLYADFGSFGAGFQVSDSGAIENGFVYTNDASAASDFLGECMAMISFLGRVDISACGMLLNQFMDVKSGRDSIPHYVDTDAFQIIRNDAYQYFFLYLNNDGATS